MTTSSSKFNITDSLGNYTRVIQQKMAVMFERQMNRIINEYQDKMREALVEIATGYTCDIAAHMDDYANEQKITVEVKWPNDNDET
jgi:hypothetical protein